MLKISRVKADISSLAESWIDLTAQQPAPPADSSSHSHSPEPEHLNSTLRASNQRQVRRRRLTVSAGGPLLLNLPRRPSSIDNSSQDEYDESESESDRVMTSSNEDIYHSTLASQMRRGEAFVSEDDTEEEEEEEEGDDEDDHATALGTGSNLQCFTPQPNAFSHPPSSLNRSSEPVPGSYFPATGRTAQQASSRHSHPSESRRQTHTPYTTIAPSSTIDHDALLRDSLSTILSCAAAARGHSKSQRTQPKRTDHIEPSTLRMVPESALLKPEHSASTNPSAPTSSRSSSKGKGKRKATRSRSASKDRQQGQYTTKKARRASNDALNNVSPTLLTWCVAGGVVVLVSALSFSAGYVVGKETGRLQAATGLGHGSSSGSGRTALKSGLGLRRSVVGAVSA